MNPDFAAASNTLQSKQKHYLNTCSNLLLRVKKGKRFKLMVLEPRGVRQNVQILGVFWLFLNICCPQEYNMH